MKRAATALCVTLMAARAGAAWEPVPAVDWSIVKLEDFADEELPIVKSLYSFHELANAVVENGEDRGFINLPVWREPKDNKPYNARILENHAALAYFYSTKKPWNPYYGSVAVKDRLEAVLAYWCTKQHADGTFAEYAADNFSLAPTAFGVRTMARTLEMLTAGPGIDADLYARVKTATRKGIAVLLKDDVWLNKGWGWTNQYSAAYAAAMTFDKQFRDPQLVQMALQRLAKANTKHISPGGYLYESYGADFGYSTVHLNNLTIALPYANGEARQLFANGLRKYYDWMAYNLVAQPDGQTLLTNSGVNCRTTSSTYPRKPNSLSDLAPVSRAFSLTDEEVKAENEAKRAALTNEWGRWPKLKPGSWSYSPTPFTDADRVKSYPTQTEREAALKKLPYIAEQRFNHQCVDPRPLVYTFVRRPTYYASFNAGKPASPRQRFGLGLIWNPQGGTFFQTQPDSSADAWGTVADGAGNVYEAQPIDVKYRRGGTAFTPKPGNARIANGELVAEYPLGSAGKKTVTFGDDAITVVVQHAGAFTEVLPLLSATPGDVEASAEGVTVRNNGATMTVHFATAATPDLRPGPLVGPLGITTARVKAKDTLTYTIRFNNG